MWFWHQANPYNEILFDDQTLSVCPIVLYESWNIYTQPFATHILTEFEKNFDVRERPKRLLSYVSMRLSLPCSTILYYTPLDIQCAMRLCIYTKTIPMSHGDWTVPNIQYQIIVNASWKIQICEIAGVESHRNNVMLPVLTPTPGGSDTDNGLHLLYWLVLARTSGHSMPLSLPMPMLMLMLMLMPMPVLVGKHSTEKKTNHSHRLYYRHHRQRILSFIHVSW